MGSVYNTSYQIALFYCIIEPSKCILSGLYTLKASTKIKGLFGKSGQIDTFVGFAPANILYKLSFADVLDEDTGRGYQRRFNKKHSLDFRRYIQSEGSTTIPLTFNLRPNLSKWWHIEERSNPARLIISEDRKVLSQVDCQHRMGFLSDIEIPLPFIVFVGLGQKQEMLVFNTINSKSKGLSSSLIDFHETRLVGDLEQVKPELLIAFKLHEDPSSPWYKQLDLGGNSTSGMQRKASLRTIQKSVKRFLRETQILNKNDCEYAFGVVNSFWQALIELLSTEWENPRKHMLNKGVGVYSLMSIASDIFMEENNRSLLTWPVIYKQKLADFVFKIDWSNTGTLKGLGGESGVREAVNHIRLQRSKS